MGGKRDGVAKLRVGFHMTLGEMGLGGLMCRKKACLQMPRAVAMFNIKINVERRKRKRMKLTITTV